MNERKIDSSLLATDRTLLAHDRTLMAWVRTSISLISFGFTVYKFFQFLGTHDSQSRILGPREFAIILIGLGVIALILAIFQYVSSCRSLKKTYKVARSFVAIFALLFAVFGIFVLIATILRG